MNQYTDEFREELLGYNLVIAGICTTKDLWENMSYIDVMKCTEAMMLKGYMGSLVIGGDK